MKSLDKGLRTVLERAVIQARGIAEDAAKDALVRLAVGQPEPFKDMSPEDRFLRIKLRARGRQLGDVRDERSKRQTIDHLGIECAYEHWHQMLFARFLAENNLLMHPDGVAVTLAECEEIAKDQNVKNGWVLASQYASRMLPQIFRPEDPLLLVRFAPEKQIELENLISKLPTSIFLADDSLGWVYQFWQSDKKEQINKSEKKISADELPAVTQLFTEDYMVLFLLHNTIGAWWVTNHPDRKPPIDFEYLRLPDEVAPASGSFEAWPKRVRDLTVLDPCCGSGHFLVAAFTILTYLLADEEGLSIVEASDIVLSRCLYGLEIDPRCTQIAAFALAFASWRLSSNGYRVLPRLNIACSGIPIGIEKTEWLQGVGTDHRLQNGMSQLYDVFSNASLLGSLIDLKNLGGDLSTADIHDLGPLLEKKSREEANQQNDSFERSITAHGLLVAAEILSRKYTLVLTNVPYLGRGKQSDTLKEYCDKTYPESKPDLATVFVERCLSLCIDGGSIGVVTSQNWLFLGTYKKMRRKLLKQASWNSISILGLRAFQTPMWDFNVVLLVLTNSRPSPTHGFWGISVTEHQSVGDKENELRRAHLRESTQQSQLNNPDSRISIDEISNENLISKYVEFGKGSVTGDSPHYLRKFWEIPKLSQGYEPWLNSSDGGEVWSGREHLVLWNVEDHDLRSEIGFAVRGERVWGKRGVAISKMNRLVPTMYAGELFDDNLAVLAPKDLSQLPLLWAYCSSDLFGQNLRKLDPKLGITAGTFVKVPFDIEYWKRETVPQHLLEAQSRNLTQWLFDGFPRETKQALHVSVARLLGYEWPRKTGSSFPDCPTLASDGLEQFSDKDGIVCIPSILGEKGASERLRELLSYAFGADWSPSKENELLSAVEYSGSPLEIWLRDGFFDQHCKLFQNRPFIWQIWDGKKDGFAALVNYHKLDKQLLQKLLYSYLGDWKSRQEDAVKRAVSGADSRLAAAKELERKLLLILEGERPYDIFIRWKSIERQPIGWEPDLNDGVRLNIRPFIEADILRKRPNIKWDKDRGKNLAGSPWGEERINDKHLSLDEKRKAKQVAQKNI